MIITKLEVQKRNKSRVNIYLDGDFFCGLSLETIMKNRIKEGQEISEREVDFLKNDTEREIALNKAVAHISKTPKTEKELIEFLQKKGFDEEIVTYSIEKLKDYGFIDDKAYAKSYVISKSKGQGSRKISYDLHRKGIKDSIVEESLQNFSKEKESINIVAEKYMKNKDIDAKTKQKAYRHLLSRGYSSEDIVSCLNNIFKGE